MHEIVVADEWHDQLTEADKHDFNKIKEFRASLEKRRLLKIELLTTSTELKRVLKTQL